MAVSFSIATLTLAGAAQFGRLDGPLADVQDELPAPRSPRECDLLTRLLTRVLGHHTSTFE